MEMSKDYEKQNREWDNILCKYFGLPKDSNLGRARMEKELMGIAKEDLND